jgi:hypothetical protein
MPPDSMPPDSMPLATAGVAAFDKAESSIERAVL